MKTRLLNLDEIIKENINVPHGSRWVAIAWTDTNGSLLSFQSDPSNEQLDEFLQRYEKELG